MSNVPLLCKVFGVEKSFWFTGLQIYSYTIFFNTVKNKEEVNFIDF